MGFSAYYYFVSKSTTIVYWANQYTLGQIQVHWYIENDLSHLQGFSGADTRLMGSYCYVDWCWYHILQWVDSIFLAQAGAKHFLSWVSFFEPRMSKYPCFEHHASYLTSALDEPVLSLLRGIPNKTSGIDYIFYNCSTLLPVSHPSSQQQQTDKYGSGVRLARPLSCINPRQEVPSQWPRPEPIKS